jgi:hypothetical protein
MHRLTPWLIGFQLGCLIGLSVLGWQVHHSLKALHAQALLMGHLLTIQIAQGSAPLTRVAPASHLPHD